MASTATCDSGGDAGSTAGPCLPPHTIDALYIGRTAPFSKAGRLTLRSGMNKAPVEEFEVMHDIIEGDEHHEKLGIHGGPTRVVHHIPSETYGRLATLLPAGQFDSTHLHPGGMGENVSSTGLGTRDVCIGDVVQAGTAVLQVCQPRMPCFKLNHRFKCHQVSRIVEANRLSGWFYRALKLGKMRAGEPLVLVKRPYPQLTVYACYGMLMDPELPKELIQQFADCEELDDEWRFMARHRLEHGFTPSSNSSRRISGGNEAWQGRGGDKTQQAASSSNKLVLLLWLAAIIAVIAVAARVIGNMKTPT